MEGVGGSVTKRRKYLDKCHNVSPRGVWILFIGKSTSSNK